jgi:hypothetical protein
VRSFGRGGGKRARAFSPWALLALAFASVACESSSSSSPALLFTLYDVGPYLEATRDRAGTPADQLPTGFPSSLYSRGPEGSASFTLNVTPTFVEGQVAAYTTAETWRGFAEVWMQPMYVLATADAYGKPTPIAGQPPIFSVGPASAFYSPFWRVNYALVPAGAPPEKYRSSAAIRGDGLPLVVGPAKLCVLAPHDVDITGYQRAPDDVPPPHPLDPTIATQSVRRGSGLVDGESEPTDVLDFGADRYTWNSSLVVDETPVFVFEAQDSSGTRVAVGLPSVGGTGPLWSSTPPRETNGKPAFGSLWRLYHAMLPAGAGAIVPDSVSGAAVLRDRMSGLGLLPQAEMPAAWVALGTNAAYVERPVLNAAACFAAPRPDDGTCVWIDSQAAVESNLAASIRGSDMLVTCPLVVYDGKTVP